MNIFVDVETIPSQRNESRAAAAAKVKPPGSIKKAETLAKWNEESRPALEAEAWSKTALDGGWGELCVIGWAIEDDDVQVASRATVAENEADVLREFFDRIAEKRTANSRPITWIGHNLAGFDLRFLWQRAVVLGVQPPFTLRQDSAPWSHAIDDTMQMWAGNRGSVGLVALCEALRVDVGHEDTITGADVWSEFQAGHIDTIVRHCVADVERTRECWRRMTFQ